MTDEKYVQSNKDVPQEYRFTAGKNVPAIIVKT